MTISLHAKPQFSPEEAASLARAHFGIKAVAHPLDSERDQNFRLSTDRGEAVVLKIANGEESREVLQFQNQILETIKKKRDRFPDGILPCPEVLPSVDGAAMVTVAGKENQEHLMRLITYLPGKPMAKAHPHDEGLLTGLGRLMGTLDRCLEGCDHPAAHFEFHWDLALAGTTVAKLVAQIGDDRRRALVEGYLARYQREIAPQVSSLRTGIIHNDANDYNILVAPGEDFHNRVTGIIDFGDMLHTQIVNEVAIACAYAMLDKTDPVTAATRVVAGYHTAYPLKENELALLFDLICMRLCTSVCHSAHQRRLAPENEYLSISESSAWDLLERLQGISPNLVHYRFLHACGFSPVPAAKRVVQWLQTNKTHLAHVTDHDLGHGATSHIFDLSVGSHLLDYTDGALDMAKLSQRIFGDMAAANASVGIGRYDEARLVYTHDRFSEPTETSPEKRTIHLGMDLFMPAGSQVYTPMAGKVHSVAVNQGELDYGPTIILEHQVEDDLHFFTLYGHLSPDAIEGLQTGQSMEKGAPLATLGAMADNGGWPPHLHFQIITDMLDFEGDFPGVALPSQRGVWTALCPDPNLILGIPLACFPDTGASRDALLESRREKLGRNLSISYRKPLKIVRGMGPHLISDEGQSFLDGVNNVCHVGHCHPHVVAAGRSQMAVLNTNTRYLHDNIVDFAERLLAKFPDPLGVCYFVCTGSEANELALRMARTHTGARDLIILDGAYHGNTQGCIDISPYKHDGPGGSGRPPWVHKVPMPDGYRGLHKGQSEATGIRYAQYVGETVEGLQASGKPVAAFICESMLGCGGQIVLPDGYMRAAFEHVRRAGGVCIADEVQVGFGRAGNYFWAFESQGVIPDIVTLGKPIGNGHPLAAVVTTPAIADTFNNGMEYFNTFGGNPVSCAIGLAVLDVIESEELQENAYRVGKVLLDGLSELQKRYRLIGDVRGLGLYIGVELVTDHETLEPATEQAGYIVNRMKEYGFLLSTDGPMENILKLKPPMVISAENARDLLAALDKVFAEDGLQ